MTAPGPVDEEKAEGDYEYALEADPGQCTASFPTFSTLDEALNAATAPVMSKADLAPVRVLRRLRGPWAAMNGDAPSAPEVMYAIRRKDGEPIDDNFTFLGCDGPDDWTFAEESDFDVPTELQIVRMDVTVVAERIVPECGESGCTEPATYWGLCEPHAREDDPSAFDDEPSSGSLR